MHSGWPGLRLILQVWALKILISTLGETAPPHIPCLRGPLTLTLTWRT